MTKTAQNGGSECHEKAHPEVKAAVNDLPASTQLPTRHELPLVAELSPCPDVMSTLRAFCREPDVLLLESAQLREHVGRYSFLTADPFEFHEINRPPCGGDPLTALQSRLQQFASTAVAGLPPFQGGAAGLLSYELGGAWERLPLPRGNEFEFPLLAIGLYDWVVAWDHLQDRAWIISQGFPETEPGRRSERAARRLNAVRQRLHQSSPPEWPNRTVDVLPASRLVAQRPAPGLAGLTSNFSRDEYLRAVTDVIEYIYAGDIFQANLSQRLLRRFDESAFALYDRLRRCNPAPFAGCFAHDDWAIVSASPERFLRIEDGEIETRPIKGTRHRPAAPEADLYTRDALRQSEKDQAENVMIVDLLRNDLSRVCAPGSIHVPRLCAVESYETVQHLVSEIRGRLADNRDVWDLYRAAFPGGSITGAPKIRAMQIIGELEPTVRGAYCGCLLYVGFDGRSDSSILIRTFSCRRGWVQCPVGGGIVAQSHPLAEYEETLYKAEGMLRALRS